MTPARAWLAAAVAVGLVCVAVPFFAATTFFGDDHLFLTFARHVQNPLRAFTTDLHGGEYYRPLWMVVWWGLAHLGGAAPFAAAALLLHGSVAALVVLLVRALGRPDPVALTAGALMFLAPQNLAAASWFSASTDLLATALAVLGLLAIARDRFFAAIAATAAACLCKESAYVLPVLAAIVLLARDNRSPLRRDVVFVAAQTAVVLSIALIRRIVLHGWGGGGQPRPGLAALVVQIAAGLARTFTGDEVVPPAVALLAGAIVMAIALWSAWRSPGGAGRFAPLALAAAATLPLLAADWAVGARYDYLPAVGLCWAVAEALGDAGPAARGTLAVALLLIGVAQAAQRRQDVVSYDRRVAAARRAVRAGLARGHQVFHVDGGIKDLDLVIKEDPAVERAGLLVLGDVPASFAIVPPALQAAARPLLAVPPIPPSGAYRFGDVQVVGLARRGDEPDLSEALAWFPDLRFIRLMRAPGGQVVARDVTERVERRLDGEPAAGQD